VDFINNYVKLMRIRLASNVEVNTSINLPNPCTLEIAPMIFISLVENAFKHGVNARYPSFVRIAMRVDGDSLVFTSDNSRFEKQGTDRIGSGIGLENMKRRLELLYPGRYTYEQTVSEDAYHVKVTLKIL
jgi:LytS/YehU family sensor histidine kinase